jgi:hypothetical protein
MTGLNHSLCSAAGASITKAPLHCAQMCPVGTRRWSKQQPGVGFQA